MVAMLGACVLLLKLDNWLATLTREFAYIFCFVLVNTALKKKNIGFIFAFR
jgi:uncharacterized membrane protein YjjP (DUF1212 family)